MKKELNVLANKVLKLDIGCGNNKVWGGIGIDELKTRDVDIISNIEVDLPFKDMVFNEVYMNHVLEHVDDIFKVLEEVHRVLKGGGKVYIRVPCFSHPQALTHPQHKHAFHHDSLLAVTEKSNEPYTVRKFKMLKNEYVFKYRRLLIFPKLVLNKLSNKYKNAYLSIAYLFPADEVYFILEKCEKNSYSKNSSLPNSGRCHHES